MQKFSTQSQNMTSEEMKNDLINDFETVKARHQEIETKKTTDKGVTREIRKRAIQSLYTLLEDYGVDTSNLESISAFLNSLRAKDPDLAELFEIVFTDLTAEEEKGKENDVLEENKQYDNAGMMNKFRNLAPEVMMPR